MKRTRPFLKPALLLVFAASCQSALSAVLVNITASPASGGNFLYTVQVTNTDPVAQAIVSITDVPKGQSIIGNTLTGPAGYVANYDPGLPAEMFGQVQLVGGTPSQFAPSSTVGGFSFQSSTAPFTGFFNSFMAIDNDGGITTGSTTVVPEPAAALLGFIGLVGLSLRRKR